MFNACVNIFSAAKAPYLARFRVSHCGIHEMENKVLSIGKEEEDAKSREESGKEYWQAAIFKVGDDVRQVNTLHFLLVFLI